MNEAERAVCARLRSLRIHSKSSQSALAKELGISRAKLISIEYGQTPLRYDLGNKICRAFDLSQIWLAEGVGSPHPCHLLADEVEDAIPPGILFTDAHERFIKQSFSEQLVATVKAGGPANLKVYFGPIGLSPDKQRAWKILREIRTAIGGISPNLHIELWRAVDEVIDQFCEKHRVARKRVGFFKPKNWPALKPMPFDYSALSLAKQPSLTIGQAMLDTGGVITDSPAMQALKSVPDLIKRLKKLSKELGSKAALARKLGVSRQAVDQWLNGTTTPSTDIVIKVMNLE